MQEALSTQEIAVACWARQTQASTIQQLLAVATQPDILSFALGLPAAELFPTSDYAQAVAHVLATQQQALQYGPSWQPLRKHIVGLMAHRGVDCREEQIFLTTGAQQGMSLLARLLLNVEGYVLLEETIYSGIVQAVEPLQPRLLTVPTDPKTGIDVGAVEAILAGPSRPAFIYVISDGHNPLGISMSQAKRYRLIELARHYKVPIIEDDAYGLLWYDDHALPSLRALEQEWVFYLGSFSKILAPALRVGWMVVPETLIPVLATLKEGSDINTATFSQRTVAAYLDMGYLPEHVAALRREYRHRRDTMIEAIQAHFPPETRYHIPTSGMFLWVEIPDSADMEEVASVAIFQEKVAFVPGQAFQINESQRATYCMRLNFSNCHHERITYGIACIAKVISKFL
jgi:2-aminoadipate transaminase